MFAWAPADTIRRTIETTTQYARGRVSDNIRQHWKSRFTACNVRRRNEAVATDTVFSDTPAVDSGVKAAQLFIGPLKRRKRKNWDFFVKLGLFRKIRNIFPKN